MILYEKSTNTANASAKSSQIWDFQQQRTNEIFDNSPKKPARPVSAWAFHPLYSIFMHEHHVPTYRKLIQLHFTLTVMLWVMETTQILGLFLAPLISWLGNYVFGFIMTKLMTGDRRFSLCSKVAGVAFYFLALFAVTLLLAPGTLFWAVIIYLAIAYAIDLIFFDSLVVWIAQCSPSARRWFSVRGFAE